jgi:transposase
MARITRAAFHVSIEEVKERMNNDPRPLNRKRWLIIYNALIEPREAKDIARHTGVSVATVHQVISTYNRLGVAAVETPGKGGRRHEYMTVEEERELLTPFIELAQKGELTTIAPIKQAFEKRVGHEVDETTIYRLLKRHQWRKLVPRPFHPKADQEEQRLFQENFATLVEEALESRDPEDERPVLKMAQDEACDAAHQHDKTGLGTQAYSTAFSSTNCARVYLCVCCCGSTRGENGLSYPPLC